jgi:tripartite-type tricarboxylate transporter receptor subunit TctC
MLKIVLLLLTAVASLVAASGARCQEFPSRPANLVVPYPPGTNADVIARLLADKLARSLKQPFVVENRPGGATVPATSAVLQAPADGHTMLESGTATNINPLLGVKTAYDVERDLAPVILLVTFPGVLVLNRAWRRPISRGSLRSPNPSPVSSTTGRPGAAASLISPWSSSIS